MKTLVIHPKDSSTDFLKVIYSGRDDFTVITGGESKADVAKAIDEHDHIIMLGHGTPQGLLSMGQFNRSITTPSLPAPAGKVISAVTQKDLDDLGHWPTTVGQYSKKTGQQSLLDDEEEGDNWGYKPYHGTTAGFVGGGNRYGGYGGSYGGYGYAQQLLTSYVIDADNAEQLRGKKVTAIWCNADQFMLDHNLTGFFTGMFISEPSEAKMIGTADVEKWQVEQQNYAFVEVVRRFIDADAPVLHAALNECYGPLAERNAVAKYNLKRFFHRLPKVEAIAKA